MSVIVREIEGIWLRYYTETGKFERLFYHGYGENGWQPDRWKQVAKPNKGSGGYCKIRIGGKRLQAHRVAWYMYYQEWPTLDIDHINGDKTDNRFLNLREVTRAQNALNRRRNANNKTGIMGVFLIASKRRWGARIGVNGVNTYLGSFETFEGAVARRKAAEIEYGYHPNHGGRQ